MKTKVSFKIIFILLLLILTLPIGAYVSLSSFNKLQNDANTVNDVGYIRGSMQRFLQCNVNNNNERIVKEIEIKFQEINRDFISQNRSYLNIGEFQNNYHQLEICWKRLKEVIHKVDSNLQNNQVEQTCWDIADRTANAATKIAEKKHDKIVLTIVVIGTLILLLLTFALFLIYTEVRNRLEINVIQDPLTKLYNRSHLFEQLHSRIKSFERSKHPFSVLFVDIDNFKQINDSYGHQIGDNIIKRFASILQMALRDEDMAFRYGGEEFVILAKDANACEACQLAERIRKRVSAHDFKIDYPVTVSLGVSEYRKNDSIDKLLGQADHAMYKAKAKGRNQTCAFTS